MAQVWTLETIRNKVRKITGRPLTAQISDGDIDDYIDNYYQYVLPLQTESTFFDKFSGGAGFTGTTSLSVGEYALSANVIGIKKPFVLDSEEIPLSFDLQKFLLDFPPDDDTPGKPTHALLWERKVYLRPLPDDNNGDNWDFEAPILDMPSGLVDDGDQPVDGLYGPTLAYGASIDIFKDNGEAEQAAEILPILEGYVSLIFRKDVIAEIGRTAFPNF